MRNVRAVHNPNAAETVLQALLCLRILQDELDNGVGEPNTNLSQVLVNYVTNHDRTSRALHIIGLPTSYIMKVRMPANLVAELLANSDPTNAEQVEALAELLFGTADARMRIPQLPSIYDR